MVNKTLNFIKYICTTIKNIIRGFKTNLFSFKLDKTNFMYLKTRDRSHIDGNVCYGNKLISNKFEVILTVHRR